MKNYYINKIKIILLLVISMVFITSCVKDEMDINLTTLSVGNLKLTVTSSNGNPIADQKVEINQYNGVLEDTKTDANGVAVFNDLLMGSYSINMKKVDENGIMYDVFQAVQVVNGITKEYKITPSDYSGTVTLTIFNDMGEVIEGINVGIFRGEDLTSGVFEDILAVVKQTGTTDSNGQIIFDKVPLAEYGIMVYNNSNDYKYSNYHFYISSKGQERKVNYYFY